jgi:hypothetical protein
MGDQALDNESSERVHEKKRILPAMNNEWVEQSDLRSSSSCSSLFQRNAAQIQFDVVHIQGLERQAPPKQTN